MNDVVNKLGNIGLVPVIAIEDAADAALLGQALLDGGLPVAEITFRTAAAAQAISNMKTAHPAMLVGAGTVLTVGQAQEAQTAGAQFVVTPGFDAAVVNFCLEQDLPITPGVMTPTDINQALAKGLRVLKFFPAEAAGGLKTLKAIGGPYGGVKFIPTGGINAGNLASYLSSPLVHACGGSWMVKKDLISAGAFDQISELAREAVELVKKIRRDGGG